MFEKFHYIVDIIKKTLFVVTLIETCCLPLYLYLINSAKEKAVKTNIIKVFWTLVVVIIIQIIYINKLDAIKIYYKMFDLGYIKTY